MKIAFEHHTHTSKTQFYYKIPNTGMFAFELMAGSGMKRKFAAQPRTTTMTTAFYGCEYASMSFNPRSSHTSGKTQSATSVDGTVMLPTPPGSTRPSIDNPIKTPQKTVPTEESLYLRESLYSRFTNNATSTLFGPAVSPPASVVGGSPPKTNSVENIVIQLQPIFDSEVRECGVEGVTPALFKALEAHMMEGHQAGVWERLQ